jgi:HlyD family secretion protein
VVAFPRRGFSGEIVQIRKSPVNVQNVISYTVVISARNPDLSLLPGMTANVRIVVERRESALKVPNAALRFRPAGATEPPPAQRRAPEKANRSASAAGRVWILEAGAPKPVDLRLGLNDGTSTELVEGSLSEGAQVIVGLAAGAQNREAGGLPPHMRLF